MIGFESLRLRLRPVNEVDVLQKCLGLESHDLETLIYPPLAQLVEHVTLNHGVQGSSP